MAGSLLVDVAKFTATSGGTGSFVVSAAVTGYQTPATASAVTATQYSYRAESADLTQWEVGQGTYTSSNTTITRTPLFNSVGGTSAINFTLAPQVGFVLLSEDTLPVVSVSPLTASTSADIVLLSSVYLDGPTIVGGSTVGTWFASGTVSFISTAATAIDAKLYDATTIVDSARASISAAGFSASISLSGFFAAPSGAIRIAAKDFGATGAIMRFNATGSSRDSTVTAYRIK